MRAVGGEKSVHSAPYQADDAGRGLMNDPSLGLVRADANYHTAAGCDDIRTRLLRLQSFHERNQHSTPVGQWRVFVQHREPGRR